MLDSGLVSNIGRANGDGITQFFFERGQIVSQHVGHHDLRAFSGEQPGRRGADAAGGTRDNGDLTS